MPPVNADIISNTVSAFKICLFILFLQSLFVFIFTADGVRVWLTYSPRNSQAVSEASTPEAIAALDAYFRENLNAVFLTPLQDSLMPGRYFYGTDNHLSTNGVALRTAQVITALKDALQKEGLTP